MRVVAIDERLLARHAVRLRVERRDEIAGDELRHQPIATPIGVGTTAPGEGRQQFGLEAGMRRIVPGDMHVGMAAHVVGDESFVERVGGGEVVRPVAQLDRGAVVAGTSPSGERRDQRCRAKGYTRSCPRRGREQATPVDLP